MASDNIDDLQTATIHLRLEVEQLVSRIETASDEAWSSLSRYRKVRVLIDRLLNRAHGRQASACHWALVLGRLRPKWRSLIGECERLMRRQGQSEQLAMIKQDLTQMEQLFIEWSNKSYDEGGGE